MTQWICRYASVLDQAVEAVLECVWGFTVWKKYTSKRERDKQLYTCSLWNTWAVFSAIAKIMTAHPSLLGGKFPYFCFRGTFKAIYCHNSYTAGLRTICLLKSARGCVADLLI